MIKATFLFVLLISLWQSTLCLTFQTQSNHVFNQYSILLEPSDSISCPEGLHWGLRREALPRLASVRHFLIFWVVSAILPDDGLSKDGERRSPIERTRFQGRFPANFWDITICYRKIRCKYANIWVCPWNSGIKYSTVKEWGNIILTMRWFHFQRFKTSDSPPGY